MQLKDNSRRLAIFAFYDERGKTDDYVIYLANAMRKAVTKQIIVVNGAICDESAARLHECADLVIRRDNSGYDISAYKDAFLSLTQADISQYDEIIFYNSSVYGPLYPLTDMLNEMAQRDLDFWGVSAHSGASAASWDMSVAIPAHIQSYFFAVRQNMFASDDFVQYWHTLAPICSYWDAVQQHEIRFTSYFSDKAYIWQTLIPVDAFSSRNDYPLIGIPCELIRDYHCPFIKRKSFIYAPFDYLSVPQGAACGDAFCYISRHTQYPIKLITDNLLSTVDLYTITHALGLCYDLNAYSGAELPFAAVFFLCGNTLDASLIDLMHAAVGTATLFVICETENVLAMHRRDIPDNAHISVCDDGYFAMFSLLWDKISLLPYVQYMSSSAAKLLGAFDDATAMGDAIASLAADKCISILEAHSELGLLSAVSPSHQEHLSMGMAQDISPLCRVLEAHNINVPLSTRVPLPMLTGGMFFARTQALAKLSPLKAEEKTEFQQAYAPLAAQASGFLTAYVSRFDIIARELNNNRSMLDALTIRAADGSVQRYDQLRAVWQDAFAFFDKNHNKTTLDDVFSSRLTLKQKFWVIYNVLRAGHKK